MAGQLVARGKRTWLVRVPLGRDTAGRRRYHNHTVHGTKKQAEAYLHRVLHERSEGTFWQPTKLTVDAYFDHWFGRGERNQHKGESHQFGTHRFLRYPRRSIPLDAQP